jgi:hypothetical protein
MKFSTHHALLQTNLPFLEHNHSKCLRNTSFQNFYSIREKMKITRNSFERAAIICGPLDYPFLKDVHKKYPRNVVLDLLYLLPHPSQTDFL